MSFNIGDTIRLKTINVLGFSNETYEKHGYDWIVLNIYKDHMSVKSVLTGSCQEITIPRYEISKVYNFDLPEELFKI